MRQLGEARREIRKADRVYIKGQKYTLLSRWENLTSASRQALERREAKSW